MDNNIRNVLSKRLEEDNIVLFRLYNALYKITFMDNKFFIKQEGVEITYTYDSLYELLNNYKVYGNTLMNE